MMRRDRVALVAQLAEFELQLDGGTVYFGHGFGFELDDPWFARIGRVPERLRTTLRVGLSFGEASRAILGVNGKGLLWRIEQEVRDGST